LEELVMEKVHTRILHSLLFAGAALGLLGVAQAVAGHDIDPVDKFAWSTNASWISFAPTHGGVVVYADHLEGFAWGENIGWIRLGSHTEGSAHHYENTTQDNYGVNRDGNGNLSGYAWSSNIGWIDFAPTHGGVTIDSDTGHFDGYAWSENIGWIHFRGTGSVAYGVTLKIYRAYLPLIMRDYVVAPDLVVQDVIATDYDVQVVIRNQGNGPAIEEFWVDAYIDPNPAPTYVNQIWNDLADEGLVWGVTTDIRPGDVITFTVGDGYYVADYSQVAWPLAAGTPVYVQVDSWNADTAYGAVLESHESAGGVYNNIGSTVSTLGGEGATQPGIERVGDLGGLDRLPRRP
jgi:hypothetical protein